MTSRSLAQSNNSDKVYDPAIDFIRFLAFFGVFFTHFINRGGNAIQVDENQWWNNNLIQGISDFGGQGVTLFFGLTGFLLGRLLIREFSETGTVSVKSFYLRRILRIWPLYTVFIALCGFLNLFANSPTLTRKEIPYLGTFTYNWGQIFGDLPGTMATITWSISVEEQIYLIFPLFFLLFVKKSARRFANILIIVGVINVLGCLYFWDLPAERFTPAFLLPVGVGLLTACFEDQFLQAKVNSWISLVLLILVFAYIITFRDIVTHFIFLTFIGSALLMPALLYITRSCRLDSRNFLVRGIIYVGRRSYGCYLFHWAIWTIMVGRQIFSSGSGGFSLIGVLVGFLSTIGVSAVSYKYFESPFLAYRKRFQKVVSP